MKWEDYIVKTDTRKDFSKISGNEFWKNILQEYFLARYEMGYEEDMGSTKIILCGEAGTGKTTLARTFAKKMRKYDYQVLDLIMEELIGNTLEETRENILSLTQKISSGGKYFIILESISDDYKTQDRKDKIFYHLLLRQIEELNNREVESVFCIIIQNRKQLPSQWYSQGLFFQLELPNEKERKEYWKNYRLGLGDDEGATEYYDEISQHYDRIMRLTEGFTYSQLEAFFLFLNIVYMEDERITGEDIEFIIEKVKRKEEEEKVDNRIFSMPQIVVQQSNETNTNQQNAERKEPVNLVEKARQDPDKVDAKAIVGEKYSKEKIIASGGIMANGGLKLDLSNPFDI